MKGKFLWRVIEVYHPFWKVAAVLFGFLSTSRILSIAALLVFGKIVDGVISRQPMQEVAVLAIVSFLIFVLDRVILSYFKEKFEIANLDYDVKRQLSIKTIGKMLNLSIGQHLNENSGLKQSVITRGEYALATLAYVMLYNVVPLILEIVFVTAVLLYRNLWLGGIVFGFITLFAGITIVLNLKFRDGLKRLQDTEHDNNKIRLEILRNIEVVGFHAQEKRIWNEYDSRLQKYVQIARAFWLKYIVWTNLRGLLPGLASLLIILVGVYQIYQGRHTAGDFVVFLNLASNVLASLGSIGPTHRRCLELSELAKKYFALLDIRPEITMVKTPVQPVLAGRIEFKEISFTYPFHRYIEDDESAEDGDEPKPENIVRHGALFNVNFQIKAGEKVALVGRSGAGKTTIVYLLMRAYDPDQGQIIIDGNDLRILDLSQYRKQIGLVEQNVNLFDETLRYNILFGLNGNGQTVTEAELQRVCRLACIDRFFHRLENGLDTIIGERGIRLSGGERQRVGIARAIIKNPQVLIFDEATSNLDSESEAAIRESITNVSRGKTTIIIAHRLSTIKNVDRVLVVDQGKLVGQGTHSELLDSCPAYQNLVSNQLIGI